MTDLSVEKRSRMLLFEMDVPSVHTGAERVKTVSTLPEAWKKFRAEFD